MFTLVQYVAGKLPLLILCTATVCSVHAQNTSIKDVSEKAGVLTLKRAEQLALSEEPGSQALLLRSQALQSEATAAAQLPDPEINIAFANFPTDTFSANQEPMTQLKFGVKQSIPSAGSLVANSEIRKQQSQVYQSQSINRQAQVLREVRSFWLELYYWQQADLLVKDSKQALNNLLDVVESQYQVGRKNQHDLLRAELELSRMDNRLFDIADQINSNRAQLSRWIGAPANWISAELPDWQINTVVDDQLLLQHPVIISWDRKIDVNQQKIALAKSSYNPAWGVEVNYGHRKEDINGRDLQDFFSAGVSVKLPLFTEQRQDKTYRASVQNHQAAISDRQEVIRAMRAQLNNYLSNARHVKQRRQLYKNTILIQSKQQSDAALKAYGSDAADFNEVMRSELDVLTARLESERLHIDYLQSVAQVKYLIEYSELQELAR